MRFPAWTLNQLNSFSIADTSGLPARNPLAGNRVKDGANFPFELYRLSLFPSV
jgi:hypothetical protein